MSQRKARKKGSAPAAEPTEAPKKKKIRYDQAWQEARGLVFSRWKRLSVGFLLIVISRLAGLVLPASSKVLIDDIIGKGHSEMLSRVAAVIHFPLANQADLLLLLALVAGTTTLIQSASSFSLTLLLGVTAQRSITDMRKKVEQHVVRLPVSYFDSAKSGELISRVMNDADGIRNLVGTGLVELAGGFLTAGIALLVLFYLNWWLTLSVLGGLLLFAVGMAFTFKKLRPVFRERGKLTAEVTGRLGETLGGVRLVKAYTAERREDLAFARGAHRLFRNVKRSMVAIASVSAFSNLVVGALGLLIAVLGGHAILSGQMTLGDFVMYLLFTGMVAAPLVQIASIGTQITEAFAGLDRIREIRSLATEQAEESDREPLATVAGNVELEDVSFEYKAGLPVLNQVSLVARAGTVDRRGRRDGDHHPDAVHAGRVLERRRRIALPRSLFRPPLGRWARSRCLAARRLGDRHQTWLADHPRPQRRNPEPARHPNGLGGHLRGGGEEQCQCRRQCAGAPCRTLDCSGAWADRDPG